MTPRREQKRNRPDLYLLPRSSRRSNWKFVYKTPGVIVTAAFPYELKDIKLP